MSTRNIVLIVAGSCLALLILIFVLMRFSYQNQEIELRNQAKAQQQANTVLYDKMWKTISQLAQIAEKYKDSFKDIYTKIMDARYSDNDKLLFKFVTEQNPTLSTDLYNQVADAVKANRAEFANVQNRLIDIKREHKNLRQKVPGKWFVGDKPELEIKIVTSTKTEKVFESGKDDDVKVF